MGSGHGRRSSLDYVDADALGHHGRIVRNVLLVAQQQLQGVFAGRQRHLGLGLAGAEMQMVEVVRNGLIQRGQVGVDQKMVVPGVRAIRACRRDPHTAETEVNGGLLGNRCAVRKIDEVDCRAWR